METTQEKQLVGKMPENPDHITKDLVKSILNLELAADNYQKLLQDAENIHFTRDNINQDYSSLKKLREVKTKLKNLKDVKKRPFIDANNSIEKAFKEINDPIDDILNRKTEEFKKINEEIAVENMYLEQQKKLSIERSQSIKSFINNATTLITNATTDSEIVRIQKAIGSEKARVNYYGNLIEVLKSACDNLTPLINGRKEFIREAESIKKKQKEALAKGDIQTATDLFEKNEFLQAEIAENKIRLQETAFVQNEYIPVIIPEITQLAVKPRRQTWKWRIDDIQLLFKKMPHLIDLIPNKEKIDDLLSIKRADESLKDMEELKIFGLTFYLEKTY